MLDDLGFPKGAQRSGIQTKPDGLDFERCMTAWVFKRGQTAWVVKGPNGLTFFKELVVLLGMPQVCTLAWEVSRVCERGVQRKWRAMPRLWCEPRDKEKRGDASEGATPTRPMVELST